MSRLYWLSNLLVGLLVAFATWAVIWALSNHNASHYGLEGDVATLSFVADGSRLANAQGTSERLQAFLRSNSVTLVVASLGDGAPQLAVYNARDRLAWLPSTGPIGGKSAGHAYLFKGTYSFDRWREAGVRPLVPDGIDIVGAVARPPGVDRLQFAVVDPSGVLPGGRFVLTTVSSGVLAKFVELATAEGLSLQGANSTAPFGALLSDPLVLLSFLMLVTGVAGVATYWSVLFSRQGPETRIRSQSGGSATAVVSQYLKRFSLPPLIGVPLGCLASFAIVRAASGQWPDGAIGVTLGGTGAAGSLTAVAILFLVLFVLTRRQMRIE